MHDAAFEWVAQFGIDAVLDVLDIGGRNVNGSVRAHFPQASWVSLDIMGGPGVDIIADAATWIPDNVFDIVVCTEVFEHAPAWPEICTTAWNALRPGGLFLATCAGPGRAAHSGIDGGTVRPGEYYANVYPSDLQDVLERVGFRTVYVERSGEDVRSRADK